MWDIGRTRKLVIKFWPCLQAWLYFVCLSQPRTWLCKLQALDFFFPLSFNTVLQFIKDNCHCGAHMSFSSPFKQYRQRNWKASLFAILLSLFILIVTLSKQLNGIYEQVFCVSVNESKNSGMHSENTSTSHCWALCSWPKYNSQRESPMHWCDHWVSAFYLWHFTTPKH